MVSKSKYVLVLLLASVNCVHFDPPPEEQAIFPSVRVANEEEYRLPESAVDVFSYNIELDIRNQTFHGNRRFDGYTIIRFRSLRDTRQIKLHAVQLQITEVRLFVDNDNEIGLETEFFISNSETDILTLNTTAQLTNGNIYVLHLRHISELRSDRTGFYRSTYIDQNGREHVLGSTQFEPARARRAFPCFDEPSYKAEFSLKIRHPRQYTAISNTRGTPEHDPNDTNFITTTFEKTPRMATYLLAFVVSDFTCTQSVSFIDEDIPNYICSRDEAASTRELAADYAPRLTKSLEDFTGLKYRFHQISKLNHFAVIPAFSGGAMENWGLITYSEQGLLWDPEDSSNQDKQVVITVVAHELAHFWFGNLVTTNWWSDIFLNEGFAAYFEYHTPHEINPSLQLDKQFVLEKLHTVLVNDASSTSAALSSPAYTPTQISGKFNSIAYNKGGSIFRMVEKIIGLDNFKSGLNTYLRNNAFHNTRPEDLWIALQEFAPTSDLPAGKNLATVMENWIIKPGYPILNVTTDGDNITITQQRYLTNGEPGTDEKWFVPVTYTTSSSVNKFQSTKPNAWLLPDADLAIRRVLQNTSDWIILNNQQTGYYRVDYDNHLLGRIKIALNQPGFDGIHELNRAHLIDDFFNFAKDGHRSFSEFFELCRFLKKDPSYYSWSAATNAFSLLMQRTTNEPTTKFLSKYILELLEISYNFLPFNEAKEEDHIFSLRKALVMPWACRLGIRDCIDNAVVSFNNYRVSNKKPDKNLRSTIYCNGLRHSQNVLRDFDFLWAEFEATKLASEQETILSGLGCAKDPGVLRNFLSKSIDRNSGIRQQDAGLVYSSVYTNSPEGVDIALDFFLENYPAILEYFGTTTAVPNLFYNLASRFTREEQAIKLLEFIEGRHLGDVQEPALAAHGTAMDNLKWIEKFEKEVLLYSDPESFPSGASTIKLATILTAILVFCYQLFY